MGRRQRQSPRHSSTCGAPYSSGQSCRRGAPCLQSPSGPIPPTCWNTPRRSSGPGVGGSPSCTSKAGWNAEPLSGWQPRSSRRQREQLSSAARSRVSSRLSSSPSRCSTRPRESGPAPTGTRRYSRLTPIYRRWGQPRRIRRHRSTLALRPDRTQGDPVEMDFWAPLETEDPESAPLVYAEEERTRSNLELIASESYPSLAALQAVGSVLTAHYAEGYPGRRYYGGCEIVDQVEELARERAKALFGAEHANVQPHAGAQANMAVYHALLQRGDTVMGLALDQGGHLTHGSPLNFSGQYYNFVAYAVDPQTHLIDMDQVRTLAREHKPKLIVTGATAYPRLWDFAGFREIADEVGAILMTDMAHFAGLVAAGVHPSPIPHSQVVTTTTHKTLRGPRGGMILCIADLAKAIDKAVFPAIQGGPLEHVIAGKAVAFRQATSAEFRRDAAQTVRNAQALAARLAERDGVVITGRTDNHLMPVDVRPRGGIGKEAHSPLGEVNVTVNKNTIPYDPNPPAVGSGIRLGTPAVTSRGMVQAEMREIGDLIVDGIAARADEGAQRRVRERVAAVADRFPVPGVPWTLERLRAATPA